VGLNPLFCLLFSSHSKCSATEIAVPSVCLSVRLSVYDVRKTGISAQTFPTLSLRGCYVEWFESTMQSVERCHFQRPWMTLKVTTLFNIK